VFRADGRSLIDPLQLFGLSLAVLVASVVFLLAIVSGISMPTALGRAAIAWLVFVLFSFIGAGLLRWLLRPRRGA
jgi:hypothetical protein